MLPFALSVLLVPQTGLNGYFTSTPDPVDDFVVLEAQGDARPDAFTLSNGEVQFESDFTVWDLPATVASGAASIAAIPGEGAGDTDLGLITYKQGGTQVASWNPGTGGFDLDDLLLTDWPMCTRSWVVKGTGGPLLVGLTDPTTDPQGPRLLRAKVVAGAYQELSPITVTAATLDVEAMDFDNDQAMDLVVLTPYGVDLYGEDGGLIDAVPASSPGTAGMVLVSELANSPGDSIGVYYDGAVLVAFGDGCWTLPQEMSPLAAAAGGDFLPNGRDDLFLAETSGPGAVVRIVPRVVNSVTLTPTTLFKTIFDTTSSYPLPVNNPLYVFAPEAMVTQDLDRDGDEDVVALQQDAGAPYGYWAVIDPMICARESVARVIYFLDGGDHVSFELNPALTGPVQRYQVELWEQTALGVAPALAETPLVIDLGQQSLPYAVHLNYSDPMDFHWLIVRSYDAAMAEQPTKFHGFSQDPEKVELLGMQPYVEGMVCPGDTDPGDTGGTSGGTRGGGSTGGGG